MYNTRKRIVHRATAFVGLITITTFWTSTVAAELSGSVDLIVRVKTLIPWGFFVLIPALALAGSSGTSLVRGRPANRLSAAKMHRMRVVAVNGLFVLVPAALYLASKARAESLDIGFYVVQVVELLAGAANIALLSLNARDGLRMAGRFRRGGGLSDLLSD